MKRLKSPLGLAILIVLLLSIGGAAAAGTGLITGKDIKDHSITGREIKRKSIPISALRTVPSSQGERGERGEPGEPGLSGEPGEPGISALTEAFPIEGAVVATLEPSTEWQFLGSEQLVFFDGDRGQITATAAIGTDSLGIASGQAQIGICADLGDGPEPIAPSGLGISPAFPQAQTFAITVSSFFGAEAPEGSFSADVGPCVLNESSEDIDKNQRWQGTVLIAAV